MNLKGDDVGKSMSELLENEAFRFFEEINVSVCSVKLTLALR